MLPPKPPRPSPEEAEQLAKSFQPSWMPAAQNPEDSSAMLGVAAASQPPPFDPYKTIKLETPTPDANR
jgi:hypothetical protein